MKNFYKTIICLSAVLFIACGPEAGEREKDTATSGKVNIVADNEFKSLTDAELNVFTAFYQAAVIHPIYKSEDSAFYTFLNDSVRLIVSSRKLLPDEEKFLRSKLIFPEQYKIASDAVTFIVNKSNPDSLFTLSKLKAIFSDDSLWQQLGDKALAGKVNIVFDHENSGNARYVQQNVLQGRKFPSWCFAMNNDNEVIDYVSKNANAFGIIGMNSVSNLYDLSVIKALNNVRVVALASKEKPTAGDYYKPSFDNVETGSYPLCRDIYIISRETYTGLGSGFLAFVASNKGQRIIYREGLLPARMPSHTLHY